MKKCCICKLEKPFNSFYKNKNSKSGLQSKCKDCTRAYEAKYRKSDKNKIYQRNYQKTSTKFRETHKKEVKKSIAKYPDKQKARLLLRWALQTGKIIKPLDCERASIMDACFGRLEAHHNDYLKPLEVNWLCVKHHKICHS